MLDAAISPTETGIFPTLSVRDLGKLTLATDAAIEAVDLAHLGTPKTEMVLCERLDKEQEVLYGRRDALWQLAMSLPSRTLEDVATQLVTAFILIDCLEASVHTQNDSDALIRRLRRVICGAVPVVVAAAGFTIEDFTNGNTGELIALEFQGCVP